MTAETLTQEQIDAMGSPEPTGLDVRDIPGVHTAARSGEREGWRAIRGKTWSATVATTCIGSNPFQSIMDLWRERVLGIKPVFSAFSQKAMQYGTDAEPELLAYANEWVASQKGQDPTPFFLTHGYVVDDAENPRYGATPDAFRLVPLGDEYAGTNGSPWGHLVLELAEFKTGSKDWRATPRSKPKVPQNYVDQMIWQMLVTGARRVLAVQRVVKRDRAGNVIEVLGHNAVWVPWDEKRAAALVEAVEEFADMVATGTAPMVHVDAEDQFDDEPEVTAEKARIREYLTTIADAEAALEAVQDHVDRMTAAKSELKAILQSRKAKQVSTEAAGMGATLTRSTKTGYNYALLTDKQRERIITKTPVDTLRVSPLKGE